MEITFLGTGNPFGLPAPGCRCETCNRARTLGVERTRSSIHLHNERTGQSLLIDVSPDWWYQYVHNDVELADEVVITHTHYDHANGLPNITPFYDSLPVHVAEQTGIDTNKVSIAEQLRSRYEWCGPLKIETHDAHTSFQSCGFQISFAPVVHGDNACFGISVTDPRTDTKIAITSDTCYRIPEKSRKKFDSSDLLITEAFCPAGVLETKPENRNTMYALPEGQDPDEAGVPRSVGQKHMTHEGALALADELNATRISIVHTTHYYPATEAFEDPIANDGDRLSL